MMIDKNEQHFESIESAQEFIALLSVSIDDAIRQVDGDRHAPVTSENERRVLDIALYKLHLLDSHVRKSRRLLNDLRTIRRLLQNERTPAEDSMEAVSGAAAD